MEKCKDYEIKTIDTVYRGHLWSLGKNDDPSKILESYNRFIYSTLTNYDGKRTLVVITNIEKQEQKG